MIPEPATFALVLLASFAGSVIGGIGGFGTGVVLVAVLVPIVGVKTVVPVLAVAGVLINGGRAWFYRAHVDWRATRTVLLWSLPFLVAGTQIYLRLDPKHLGLLIGTVVLASVPVRRVLKAREISVGARGLAAGGAVFGLANGFASGVGVILVSLLLGAGLSGQAVLATDALISIGIDVARALLFGKFALLDGEAAVLGLAIGLATLPGSALAAFLVRRMHARLHILFMEALILVGGALIVVNSLR